MKKNVIVKSFILGLCVMCLINSCKKDEAIPEKDAQITEYDCYKKNTDYNVEEGIEYEYTRYYKNGLIVRITTPDDEFSWEYDANGNCTRFDRGNGYYHISEYNNSSLVTKKTQYIDDTINSIIEYYYSDTLLIQEVAIGSDGTEYPTDYYYNASHQLDSVISSAFRRLYYHSELSDSVISIRKEDGFIDKIEIEIRRSNLDVENKTINYYDYPSDYRIYSLRNIYGTNNKLLKRIQYDSTTSSLNWYHEDRYFYNQDGYNDKVELYTENNTLINYSLLHYHEGKLIRRDYYNANDELKGYALIENTCND